MPAAAAAAAFVSAPVPVPRHAAARATLPATARATRRPRVHPSCKARSPQRPNAAPSVLTSPLLPRLVPLARAMWRAAWLAFMSQLAPSDAEGRYKRPAPAASAPPSAVSNTLMTDAEEGGPPPQTAPLTLYASPSCPWCHRATLAAALLAPPGLTVVRVDPGTDGLWRMPDGSRLRDTYLRLDPRYVGRFTAPLLVDDAAAIIVSNESADILHLLHARARQSADLPVAVCLYPSPGDGSGVDPADVTDLCDAMYPALNDGVYRCGFATSQLAYDEAEAALFDMLDVLEARLAASRFLCSPTVVTAADVRLFPTVFRFDAVYATIFRVSRKSIRADYPAIAAWMRDMYNLPGVAETCDLQACAVDYFANLFPLNASGIVPRVALPSYLTAAPTKDRPAPAAATPPPQ